jgi:hypothetical protein
MDPIYAESPIEVHQLSRPSVVNYGVPWSAASLARPTVGTKPLIAAKRHKKHKRKRVEGKKIAYSEALPLLLFVPFRGYSLFLLPLRLCVRFSVLSLAARPCNRSRSRRRSMLTPSLV